MTRLTFRGTGDSMGVPRVYCGCEVCEEARSGGVNRRLRSLLQIDDSEAGTVLIDCGPDWGRQMEAAALREVDRILITHAHFDHIGGLVEWADACRWLGKRGEAYAPSEVIGQINAQFPWVQRQIRFEPIDSPRDVGTWRVASWRVNHGKNGYAYAFRFDSRAGEKSWAYCSDAIGLTPEQQEPLYGLDLLVLGTSFYHEPYEHDTRSVYDVVEALEMLGRWKPKRTVFTHQSHDIDLRLNYKLPENVRFAETGMEIVI